MEAQPGAWPVGLLLAQLPSPPFEAFQNPCSKQPSEKLTESPTGTTGLILLQGSVLKRNTDGCKLPPDPVPHSNQLRFCLWMLVSE